MQNIYELLKTLTGYEIPEDKKTQFEKDFSANYKTVNETSKLRAKLDEIQEQYNTLNDTYTNSRNDYEKTLSELKGQLNNSTDKEKLIKDLQDKVTNLTNTYETDKTAYEKKLAEQKYNFIVREKSNALKFTSNSAKKAFIADALAKKLPIENDNLMGFDDFVKSYKEADAGAFVNEEPKTPQEPPVPTFVAKTNTNPPVPDNDALSKFGFNFTTVRPVEKK